MNQLHKDIVTGLVFVTGVIEFISGDFIISSALFAATTFASNMSSSRKNRKN
ncbi:hypothetical protein ACH50O_20900 [Methylomonas sp. 2BW1-5-20]|jgi:hypothetical protein|uniref:hypothetical protein n=1 Tax=Methylomonas sp. 2BW1-5-20 TaxID=3376686 RepID=UPI004051F0AE